VVQAICHHPAVLDAAGRIIGNPFFLMQVEGRDPCPGNAPQQLHRDQEFADPSCAVMLAFLDDFGPDNGATRLCPGTHRAAAGQDGPDLCLSGQAGDVLMLDARLLHGATTNQLGNRRRSLLATFAEAAMLDSARATAALRGARMPPGVLIDPPR
jgi:ectoine hydroxylase-related dioxygenase (phytanoyl-CoA dioxygenase family)